MLPTRRLSFSWKMAVLVLAVGLLAVGCRGTATVSADEPADVTSTTSTTASSSFLSEDTTHDISVEVDQAGYDDAIATYEADGSKEWITEEAGLASQDSAYAAFAVNGSDAVLRLVMELPDDTWMTATLSDGGTLYKAEATDDYSYRGEDPESYAEVFDVEAGKDDLAPLIEFLDFINNSSDETLNAVLDQRLDTGSFATYLAAQQLIANANDIDGRGNNSYLYLDADTGQLIVVPWDHNLAFGGMGGGAGGAAFRDGAPTDTANVVAGVDHLAQSAQPRGARPESQTVRPGADLPGAGGADVSNVLVTASWPTQTTRRCTNPN